MPPFDAAETTFVHAIVCVHGCGVRQALGYAPVVLAAPPSPGSYDPSLPVLYLGTPEAQPWLAHFNLAGSGCTAGFEAHCLIVGDDAVLGRGGSAIVATGADVRGAIFGAYALSEELLGVDPWYQWTDNPTPYVGSITVPTGYTAFPVPAYKYRAWFSNDEDLNGNVRGGVLLGVLANLVTVAWMSSSTRRQWERRCLIWLPLIASLRPC